MKMLIVNRKHLVIILVTVLIVLGTQSSYGQTVTASTPQLLTEATLHESVVTLTLNGGTYEQSSFRIRDAVTVSGIDGVTVGTFGVDRVSDTEVTVELTFAGNIDTDTPLIFTVGAAAIVDYNGAALTAEVPVTAMEESLVAATESPLTEANLHGSVVTLTLTGRRFSDEWDLQNALTASMSSTDNIIEGITFASWDAVRVSDTKVTLKLTFSGDFDADAMLTFTLGARGIVGGYNGFTLAAEVPVTAIEESLVAATESPLTEANLHGNVVTLTLSGRRFSDEWDIERALTVSGIEGVTVSSYPGVARVTDTEATVELTFSGDFDTDATLTLTIGADAIAGYNKGFTLTIFVTAMEESLVAATEFPLIEPTLHGSIVTLTLSGRIYEQYSFEIEEALKVSGIDSVTVEEYFGVERVSDTEVTVRLAFSGDFDTDATLTLTISADAIVGYNKDFIVQVPVTAIEQSNATVNVSPSPILSPAIGEQLTLSLNIANGENVAGYQAIVLFDDSALDYVKSANGDYLPADTFFGDPIVVYDWLGETFFGENIWSGKVILAATTPAGVTNGDGTLATLTFKVVDTKASTVTLSQVYLVDSDGKRWETTIENGEVSEPPEPAEETVGDINRDGVVNIQDLVIVSARFGQTGQNSADVNADGIVDIVDLVLVAGAIENDAAAPSLHPQVLEILTAVEVKQWLSQAQQLNLTDITAQRGILFLEQLFVALTPKETALLHNYPNPFNPETWIPYHLSKDADVTLHIYAVNGTLVRTLALGHQPAGMYQNRSRAAHWDGRNAFGEKVASGLYFYTLTAGDFTATRKMLIRK